MSGAGEWANRRAGDGRLTRRQFLQTAAASTAGAAIFTGCASPTYEFIAQSRVRMAEDIISAYEDWYATTCRQCQAGCGVIVRVVAGRARKLEGNPEHPVNLAKLCARGQAAVQEQYHPDRLKEPLVRNGPRGSGRYAPVSWDQGLDQLTDRLRAAQVLPPGEGIAVVTQPLRGHPGLLVERFTAALGGQWLRLDPLAETPLRAAMRQVFGIDSLPAFDIRNARYVISFGANFLGTWLSPVHYGVEYGIFRQGYYDPDQFEPRRLIGRPRGYLVQVEPRFSQTAACADEWVPIRPGREGLLALSMAQVILSEGLADEEGARIFEEALLDAYRPELVAEEIGIDPERVRRLARDFATHRPSLAFGGQPAAAQTNGTFNVAAVLALNYLVGSVGQPGGVLFNPPPPISGLPALGIATPLTEWQRFAEQLRGGRFQAVLVHDANPVYGLPAALGFAEALLEAPFIASFSSFVDETTALADLILPSHLPLESWADDIPDPSPGLPVLSVQQPILQPLYNTRSVWDVLLAVAEEIGGPVLEALPASRMEEMIRMGARELHRRADGNVQAEDFDRFWLKLLQVGGWWNPVRPELPPPTPVPELGEIAARYEPPEFAGSPADFPFHLIVFAHNTLDDGRTAHLPWLQAAPDPVTTVVWQTWVELNPRVAERMGLVEGDIVAVESPYGRVEVPVYIHPAASPESVAMPMGQGHAFFGRWAGGRGANPMAVLAPIVDEVSGALAYAATRVRLVRTGRHMSLPKFEGSVPAYQLPDEEVLQVIVEPPRLDREP